MYDEARVAGLAGVRARLGGQPAAPIADMDHAAT